MRVRALDPKTGDMRFGRGRADFLADSRVAVAQKVGTRLALNVGDWFLNLRAGTPWRTQVLGFRTDVSRDPVLRTRILGTVGVSGLASYASQLDRVTRGWAVQATLDTAYGQTLVAATATAPNPDIRTAR